MNNIKKFREEKGLTLRELAKKTGLSAGYLCHLEKETRINPTYVTIKKISDALGKEVFDVFKL